MKRTSWGRGINGGSGIEWIQHAPTTKDSSRPVHGSALPVCYGFATQARRYKADLKWVGFQWAAARLKNSLGWVGSDGLTSLHGLHTLLCEPYYQNHVEHSKNYQT